MKVKLLYTTGKNDLCETIWNKPNPAKDEIEVKAVMTGLCSSDVAMYQGKFTTLPMDIQGHEGLGIVSNCLLYTSPSPRDGLLSRMPSSA